MGYKFVFLVCFVLTTVEVTDSKGKCSEFEWQCPNGSCVSLIDVRSGADACADTSDGSDEVKSPIVRVCELPPYPAHGKYVVYGDPKVKPGDMVTAAVLNITCDPGYENPGNDILICFEGVWASDLPKCVPMKDMCLLPAYPTHGSYVVSGMPTAVPGQALATVSLTYSCHPGYIIEGEDKRMCYQGIWSGNTVNCVESPSVSITLEIPQSKGKCSEFEWQCPDGSCVSLIDVRSGADACADGSNPGDTGDSREAAEVKCDNVTQYRCADGGCVPAGARCDGARDCADGSDERADCGAKVKRNPTTLASLCKLPPYPPHGQYSVYGDPRMKPGDMVTAAVLNITCDPGYESLGRDIVICFKGVWASDPPDCVPKNESCVLPPYPAHGSYVVAGLPDAAPGRALPTVALSVACDPGYRVKEDKEVMCYLGIWSGHVTDCEKSDSLSTTLEIKQSQDNCSASQYRCADGGCVPASARCDGARDCADGSDERADCGAKIKRNPITLASLCKLPSYPPHGQYSVYGDPRMKPGDVVMAAVLNITCDPGYESLERDIVVCFEGVWASDLPKCVETVKSCVLPPYPANGGYTVDGIPNAIPGDVLPGAVLNITCHPGYEIKGGSQRVCYRGIWCGNMADCEIPSYSCILPPYPAHGSYVVTGIPEAVPGQTMVSVHLNITCDPGYDIEGNKQRICYLGVWSGNISDCTASNELCELPPYPAHGSYAVTGLPNAVPGQALPSVVLDISCDPGYDIEGMKQIMCFGGIWSGDITDCVASKESCVLPPYPAHGSYAVTGLPNAVPGQALPSVVLDISCNPGYDIKGMKQRMCFGGIWSGDMPDCAVIVTNSCVLPPYPANGKYVVTEMPNAVPGQALDSVVLNVTCDSGYYIKGNKQLMCYRGKWSGNIADCEDVSDLCVLPPYPAHGTYSVVGKPDAVPGQVLDSVIITVTCDVGYHNLEKKYKMCYRGVWERIITDCVDSRNTCILPPLPAHGSYVVTGMPQAVPGQALDSVVLNITCNTGYGFEGDKQRMCYRGIWSENIKDCTALCSLDTRASVKFWCVNSFARPNELKWSRECNNYEPEGTVVKPQCKKNYFFPSALSRMRCVGGKWNYIARCIPEGGACVLPPKPANGSYVVTGLPYAVPGQASIFVTLIITCQEGYDTIGRKDRTCFDGIWSGGMPDCIPIENLCVLPKFPANGNYTVTSEPDAVPGQALDTAVLKVTCNSGFKNPGKSDITCYNGKWLEKIHDCVRDEMAARGRLAKRETVHHGG